MLLNCGVEEDSWESLGLKGDQSWTFGSGPPERRSVLSVIERTDVECETLILWLSDAKNWLTGKYPDTWKDWRQEEKGLTEDETVGWHHRLNVHEFGSTPWFGDGQGACCSLWGHKELETTEWLNWTELNWMDGKLNVVFSTAFMLCSLHDFLLWKQENGFSLSFSKSYFRPSWASLWNIVFTSQPLRL